MSSKKIFDKVVFLGSSGAVAGLLPTTYAPYTQHMIGVDHRASENVDNLEYHRMDLSDTAVYPLLRALCLQADVVCFCLPELLLRALLKDMRHYLLISYNSLC